MSQPLVEQCERIEKLANQLWEKHGKDAERTANFLTGKKTGVRSRLLNWHSEFDERIVVLSQFDELPFYKVTVRLLNSPPATSRGRVRITLFHSRNSWEPDEVDINFPGDASFGYHGEYWATSPQTRRPANSLEYFSGYIEWLLSEMEIWVNKEK